MTIEYDGSQFSGWQIQNGQKTVQETMERALETVLHTRPDVVGSGRTDSGVHARGQVAHFRAETPLDTYRLLRSLNGLLPDTIAVKTLDRAEDSFHARYDARLRRYRYYIGTRPFALERNRRVLVLPEPDFDVMNTAAGYLLGRHDFSAFCRTRSETINRVCDIRRACWAMEHEPSEWVFEISADRFLHGMVRAVVGTLLDVGHGKRHPDNIPVILASGDRRRAGAAAPARGLVLEEVTY